MVQSLKATLLEPVPTSFEYRFCLKIWLWEIRLGTPIIRRSILKIYLNHLKSLPFWDLKQKKKLYPKNAMALVLSASVIPWQRKTVAKKNAPPSFCHPQIQNCLKIWKIDGNKWRYWTQSLKTCPKFVSIFCSADAINLSIYLLPDWWGNPSQNGLGPTYSSYQVVFSPWEMNPVIIPLFNIDPAIHYMSISFDIDQQS